MKPKIAILVIFFLCAAFAYPHTHEKKMNLAASGIEVFEVDCGAGILDIRGSKAIDKIEVTAEIIIKGVSENKAKDIIQKEMKLSLERSGNKAILISQFESRRFSVLNVRGRAINLTVTIPMRINVGVDDGSGGIVIEDIDGNIWIDDGSGEIRVQGIDGNLEVDDGSGVIKVAGITGDVEIDDGSGSIYVRDIGGNVTLWDGSGSIEVDGVKGNVLLKDDGSGSVNIANVQGKVIK